MNEMLNHHSHLIILPRGGLGNRLLTVFSTIRHIVECRFAYATICWRRDIECGINLDELLRINLPNIHITDDHLMPSQVCLNKLVKHKGATFLETCYFFDIIGEQLVMDDRHMGWYKNNINNFIKILIEKDVHFDLSRVIGVHCRRSDWGIYNEKQEIIADHEILLDRLDRDFLNYLEVMKINTLFLSTDSNRTLEYFLKSRINVLYQGKCHYPPSCVMEGKGRNRDVMIESFIDMLLLSKCSSIISDSISTFSLVASILGNIDRKIWERTVLYSCRHNIDQPIHF